MTRGHPSSIDLNQYLTTREVCELLRLKERKVYELVNTHQIPYVKVTGRLLFPKAQITEWLKAGFHDAVDPTFALGLTEATPAQTTHLPPTVRPRVMAGSHCPLLEWAIRESRCGLATRMDGSMDGLRLFESGEALATGLHLHASESDTWNIHAVSAKFGTSNATLLNWVRRQQGFIVKPGNPSGYESPKDLKNLKVAIRPQGSGAYNALLEVLTEHGLQLSDLNITATCHTEADSLLAVISGQADVALGLEALAHQYQAHFVPWRVEEVDLLIDRKSWFEPEMQALWRFTQTANFATAAAGFKGYDLTMQWQVRWNA